jgi:hypothetical protein
MPPITKGGPRPVRKDYKSDAAFQKALEQWMKLNPSTTSSPTVVGGNVVEPEPIEYDYRTQDGKPRSDWTSFTDGSFNLQQGDAAIGQTPYVTASVQVGGEKKPTPVVILPSTDGKGFEVVAVEKLLQDLTTQISRDPNNAAYWKQQLQNYYRSEDAFQRSLRGGPVSDKDTEFVFALRKALNEISADNFSRGVENVQSNILNSSGFYSINTWIQTRTVIPGRESVSTTTRNFTKKADAIADFMREVQMQVGNTALVDNIDALAEAYWTKVHEEELKRMGQSTSVYDPVTRKQVTTSTGFQMPSEQLLKEWRIGFITKGAIDKGKVISTGIRNVNAIDLQDAGGDIGDNYTKLKGYANDYGIRLNDTELKNKAAEASLPGGSLEEQRRTLLLSARLKYPALSEYIQSGLKVGDVASQFIKRKAEILELADANVDIFDADVQSAISGEKIMNDIEYDTKIRSNPAYRKTKQANESAAGFLDAILKMWGKVG